MGKSQKIAVVLSGCGVFDGAEIHEATLSLYFLSVNHAEYEIFAPDISQHHVINHLTGKEMPEKRNVLVESARISRGKIRSLALFKASDFDGLLFPGGFGAAKNLSDWAFKGHHARIIPEAERCIKAMHASGKPVAALCISPVLLSKLIANAELTIGDDPSTISEIEALGAVHRKTGHGEIIVDKKNKLITSPCYMLNATIAQIGQGVEKTVKALLEMV